MKNAINDSQTNTVWEKIKQKYSELFAAEAQVADFILNNPEKAMESNVSETAELSGVSDATVISIQIAAFSRRRKKLDFKRSDRKHGR